MLTCCCAESQWHGPGAALVNVGRNLRGASGSRGSPQRAWWFLGQSESSALTPPHEQPESYFPLLRSAEMQDYCPRLQMNIAGKWRFEGGVMSLSEFTPSVHVGFGGQKPWALLPEVSEECSCVFSFRLTTNWGVWRHHGRAGESEALELHRVSTSRPSWCHLLFIPKLTFPLFNHASILPSQELNIDPLSCYSYFTPPGLLSKSPPSWQKLFHLLFFSSFPKTLTGAALFIGRL